MPVRKWFVIPFTCDRIMQLQKLVRRIKVLEPSASIVAVEQVGNDPVDRGMMRNVGFLFAKALNDEIVCFHDVDILPSPSTQFSEPFTTNTIAQMYGHMHSLGGVILMHGGTFRKIGGYPSRSGWGKEDVSLQRFAAENNVNIDKSEMDTRFSGERFNEMNRQGTPLSHMSAKIEFRQDLRRKMNENKNEVSIFAKGDLDTNRNFKLIDLKKNQLYLHVQVKIPKRLS